MGFAATMTPEARAHNRVAVGGSVALLTYSPKEGVQTFQATAIDMSGAGLMVRASQPFKVGSVAFIRSEELYFLAGWARVRHCTRIGRSYRIGLQFRKSLASRF